LLVFVGSKLSLTNQAGQKWRQKSSFSSVPKTGSWRHEHIQTLDAHLQQSLSKTQT